MTDKNEKQITVREFRMWLQGVEEMQDEGWVPSNAQWAKIRQKIDSISDTQAQEPPPIRMASPGFLPAPAPVATPTGPVIPAGPSSLGGGRPPAASPLTSGLLAQQGKTKTPDIDTSSGTYESGFV